MPSEKIKAIIESLKIPLQDPLFFQKTFALVAKTRKNILALEKDNIKSVCAEEFEELSRRLDQTKIQESTSVRNILRTRNLAKLLINDNGDINLSILPTVVTQLKASLYSLGPNRQYDAKRQEQIVQVLLTLQENKETLRLLKSVSKPYSHKHADQIIRDTLQMPPNAIVSDAHARQAVLSAWMAYLRQNVGSCFATAPALVVHDEQPELFLKDLNELLATGRLKRTFGGIEYSVPLSSSWGTGDLKKPFVFLLGNSLENNDIWLSPGIIAAFEASGLIEEGLSLRKKVSLAKKRIINALHNLPIGHSFVYLNAEEIIRRVLLQHLQLTNQDLHDYENRPKAMRQGSLILQFSVPGLPTGSKNQACSNFYTLFENAKNAFKCLADNALLKAWEFTLASFAETKADFTRWNLYSSLGLGPNEPGGIGNILFEMIKSKLDQCNAAVKDYQFEYEQLYTQIKYYESRVRSASTEQEVKWLKAEYQSKANEFYLLEELRDKANEKARRYAQLFDVLIDKYDQMFPNYFQEVYDAGMHDVASGPYDDSPAGFRLLYKHGRSSTAQWTRIQNQNEFIDCLVDFFIATETEIAASSELSGLQNDLTEIVTTIVNHVKTQEFLETAFYRMAAAHKTPAIKNPLENLDSIEKKPWVYTSGGTMSTLVSCYFRREQKPSEVSRWVENPTELLVFLIDVMKQLPPKLSNEFLQNPKKSMLMHSPTHAFLFKPGLSPFKETWLNDAYTYTWLRDHIIRPMERFVDEIQLDSEMLRYLIQIFSEKVPENFRFYFKKVFSVPHGPMNPPEFRNYLLAGMAQERGLKYAGQTVLLPEEIDSSLFSLLPIHPSLRLKEHLIQIFEKLGIQEASRIQKLLDTLQALPNFPGESAFTSAKSLQEIAKALLCLSHLETSASLDCHAEISRIAQDLGLAMPKGLIFADTNWVKDEFGFLVGPGTGHLELWRVDYTGSTGFPMTSWEPWLNGSRQDISWGVYNKFNEYRS